MNDDSAEGATPFRISTNLSDVNSGLIKALIPLALGVNEQHRCCHCGVLIGRSNPLSITVDGFQKSCCGMRTSLDGKSFSRQILSSLQSCL
jgi:hypothetical protein